MNKLQLQLRHAGLQLASWGELDPASGTIDAVLGIPPTTLNRTGVRDSQEGGWLLLPIRGSAGRTKVAWGGYATLHVD